MSSLKYLVLFITTFKTIDGLRETIYFWQKGATYALTCTHTNITVCKLCEGSYAHAYACASNVHTAIGIGYTLIKKTLLPESCHISEPDLCNSQLVCPDEHKGNKELKTKIRVYILQAERIETKGGVESKITV